MFKKYNLSFDKYIRAYFDNILYKKLDFCTEFDSECVKVLKELFSLSVCTMKYHDFRVLS